MKNFKEIDTNIDSLEKAVSQLSAKIDELECEKMELQNQMATLRAEKQKLCTHPNGYDGSYWCNNRIYRYCQVCGKE